MAGPRGDDPSGRGAGSTPAWSPWAPRTEGTTSAPAGGVGAPPATRPAPIPGAPPTAVPGAGSPATSAPAAPATAPWGVGPPAAAPTIGGPAPFAPPAGPAGSSAQAGPPLRAPVADDRRSPGAGSQPPTGWPTPVLDGPLPGAPSERSRRSPALVGFVAFLVGALVVGAAFATYAFGDRRSRDGEAASSSTTAPSSGRSSDTVSALDIRRILEIAQPSVVSITTGSPDSIFGGAGSGVVISEDGLIVTNAHVVESAGGRIAVRFDDGTESPARLVGGSKAQDIALLQVDRTDLVAATLGSSANLLVGDDVVAIGNALALRGDPSVTRGIVSAKDRSIADGTISLDHLIQTDAAINPGNSGGPLVNAAGEVVGINTAIIDGAQNVGFSLAIDEVEVLIEELKAGGGDMDPNTAVLGVATVTVDAQLDDATRDQYGVTATSGALVTSVDADSAAADAGLEEGDVVLEVEGGAIGTNEALTAAIQQRQAGDEVSITVERDGRRRSFAVTLGPR